MSLDIWLMATDLDGNEIAVFDANITHNLTDMARAAGIYDILWNAPSKAGEMLSTLAAGIERLKADPDKYKKHDAPNGWGLYEHFLPFAESVYVAAETYPSSEVTTSK